LSAIHLKNPLSHSGFLNFLGVDGRTLKSNTTIVYNYVVDFWMDNIFMCHVISCNKCAYKIF